MNSKPLPPTEYLNECFTYDPISGKLFWKVRPRSHFKTQRGCSIFNTQRAGTEAGTKHYQSTIYQRGQPASVAVICGGRRLYAHLIIFALMGVTVPDGFEVDHKNTNPFDNSWANLRLATLCQNNANRNRLENKKGGLPKGVYKNNRKWSALVTKHGERFYLGSFDSPELAHAAYCSKASELFGEFARFN